MVLVWFVFFWVNLVSFGLFLLKSGAFGYFLCQKMEMSSSKIQNLANGFPRSEAIWQPRLEDERRLKSAFSRIRKYSEQSWALEVFFNFFNTKK